MMGMKLYGKMGVMYVKGRSVLGNAVKWEYMKNQMDGLRALNSEIDMGMAADDEEDDDDTDLD